MSSKNVYSIAKNCLRKELRQFLLSNLHQLHDPVKNFQ